MTNDLITPDSLSKELLHSIFDAAYMEPSWDDDGDLRVKDDIHCFVIPSEKKDRIRLMSIFGFKENSSQSQRLECVNNINLEYTIVRASSGDNNILRFDFYINVQGGITRKNIVMAVKNFLSIPLTAVADHGTDIVQ